MPEITRDKAAKVVELTPEQMEKIRNLRMDEDDFMRRGRSARTALNDLLQSLAGAGSDFELDQSQKFMWVTAKKNF
jgi:hypothetical protein